jgi:signal peptidase I
MTEPAPTGGPRGVADGDWFDDAQTTDERPREDRSTSQRSFFAELPVLVLVAFLLALLLKTFLVQAFYIPSSSMEPTLLIGDRVLVNKVVYELRDPRRGEVVVFTQDRGAPNVPPDPNPVRRFLRSLAAGLGLAQPGEKDFIKRVIGLPGDEIEVRDGVVHINGTPLPEAPVAEGGYLSARDLTPFGPFQVPEGHYFMMGDNRPNSADSRSILGPIPRDQIIGRAFVVIWPLARVKTLPAPDYGIEVSRGLPALPAAA